MASDNRRESRANEFDAAAMAGIASGLKHLAARFEAASKFAEENLHGATVAVDGGKGVYNLLETSALLVNRIVGAMDAALMPKPKPDAEAEEPAPEAPKKARSKK